MCLLVNFDAQVTRTGIEAYVLVQNDKDVRKGNRVTLYMNGMIDFFLFMLSYYFTICLGQDYYFSKCL